MYYSYDNSINFLPAYIPPGVSHGTAVASILAAVGNNGIGSTGVAWNVGIIGCSAYNINIKDMSMDTAIACVDFCGASGSNVRIIHNSWGMDDVPFAQSLQDAFGRLDQTKISVVNAAGNKGYPLAIPTIDKNGKVVVPAGGHTVQPAMYNYKFDNFVTVGAMKSDGSNRQWEGSNYGYPVDIFAPGEQVYAMKDPNNGFIYLDGTSFAAPQVSGAIVLMLSKNKNLAPKAILQILYNSATYDNYLVDKCLANGYLNVQAALQSVPNP